MKNRYYMYSKSIKFTSPVEQYSQFPPNDGFNDGSPKKTFTLGDGCTVAILPNLNIGGYMEPDSEKLPIK